MTNGQKEASCHMKAINVCIYFLVFKNIYEKNPNIFLLVFNVGGKSLHKQIHVLSFIIYFFIYKYLLSSHLLQVLLQTLG